MFYVTYQKAQYYQIRTCLKFVSFSVVWYKVIIPLSMILLSTTQFLTVWSEKPRWLSLNFSCQMSLLTMMSWSDMHVTFPCLYLLQVAIYDKFNAPFKLVVDNIKWGLILHVNYMYIKRFAWNVKPNFLRKRKYHLLLQMMLKRLLFKVCNKQVIITTLSIGTYMPLQTV